MTCLTFDREVLAVAIGLFEVLDPRVLECIGDNHIVGEPSAVCAYMTLCVQSFLEIRTKHIIVRNVVRGIFDAYDCARLIQSSAPRLRIEVHFYCVKPAVRSIDEATSHQRGSAPELVASTRNAYRILQDRAALA